MTMILDGTAGATFPAGGVGNPAGTVVGTSDSQTLTNKTLTTVTVTGAATLSSTLAVTGISSFAAGTAAAPAITRTGDLDTGVWFPAANALGLSSGGTNAVYIDSSQKVGIGTSSPATKLDVSSTTAAATFTTTQTSGTAVTINVDGGSGTPEGLRVMQGIPTLSSSAKLINVVDSAGGSLFNVQASGNVGIGTNSPSASIYPSIQVAQSSWNCHNYGAGNLQMIFANNCTDSTNYIVTNNASSYTQVAGTHIWKYAASGTAGNPITFTDGMTLDSGGNLLVGTSSNAFSSRLCVQGTAGTSTPDVTIGIPVNSSGNTCLTISRTAATSGSIHLDAFKAGVGGTNLILNALNGGSVLIGQSSTASPGGGNSTTGSAIQADGTAYFSKAGNTAIQANSNGSGNRLVGFAYQGTVVAAIDLNGTTGVTYATSSDYRLKNTIAPMTGALAKVALLKPCTYKWNIDSSNGEGFIAHELAEVCPYAVTGEKDAVNEDGSIKSQGIDTSYLVATLTAAIQELNAKFDAYVTAHP